MPVKFYPDKSVSLLEKLITKDNGEPLYGEIEIYRDLYKALSNSTEEWHVWHDLKIPTHSDLHNPYKKASAQLDFLILSKEGIVVIEVKGGKISCHDNTFYYGGNFDEIMSQDPFRQAEGYKFTLKDKILSSISKCFFCYAVAFPHVNYKFTSKMFDENLLWSHYRASVYSGSIEKFIKSVIEYTKEQHKRHFVNYKTLDVQEIEAIKKILSPVVKDKNRFNLSLTLEWLQIGNVEILEGLSKNRRIMIEGPPGSGKTTIAKAFIDQQIDKKGLYLCWNNLLMHYMAIQLRERGHEHDIEVLTFNRFLKKVHPDFSIERSIGQSENEYYENVKTIINQMKRTKDLINYDYIVVDEGQDVFDRGVDLILNHFCGYNKNGLNDGSILLLYDIDQSYSASGRNVLEISDILCEYFTHFRLNEVKRSAQDTGIKELALKVLASNTILLKENFKALFPKIELNRFKGLKEAKKYIVRTILDQIRDESSSMRGGQCILLIESCFLNSGDNDLDIQYHLTIKDVVELTEKNVADNSNQLRYTSILKYKGLEKENVFLVIARPNNRNAFEHYVGVTRAIQNLDIIMVDR